ncbi:protein-glutamine gamma-glutamyltransferase 2-like [Arapaima gigas]
MDFFKADLHCKENNKNHKTDEISIQRLIVRRGQSFILTLSVGLQSSPLLDSLQLAVETGPQASESLRTKAVFRILQEGSAGQGWKAQVQAKSSSSVTLSISSPADACIGEYSLSVNSSNRTCCIGKFVLLFNPWCPEDWTYLPQDRERQEFVLNEHGIIYRGKSDCISSLRWIFGQFEEDIVDICLKLLDVNPKCLKDAKTDYSARCNPIYVSRVLSAMVNANDDKGVLVGRWDGNYADGVAPMFWNDSVEILRKWYRNNCRQVTYGQCWVFGAVLCTTLRCLGIPCRVVTNFESAHDTNGNLIIDNYFSNSGVALKDGTEGVWNFHVWVEAWMRRPDLSQDSVYDGWQVVDPTPQEKSSGVYCCGPAPVKAVLEGHTNVQYDVPFIFAEVNADVVSWVVDSSGSKRRISADTKTVGQNISTKAVGSNQRMDITDNYKYPEGTRKERLVFEEAVRRANGVIVNTRPPEIAPAHPCISVKIMEIKRTVNSQDLDLSLSLCSTESKSLALKVRLNVQVILYTGVPIKNIWSKDLEVQLLPNKEQNLPFKVPFCSYGTFLNGANSIKVTALVSEPGRSEALYAAEKTIVPYQPVLTIKANGQPRISSKMTAEVCFENPVPEELTDCIITVTGWGLLQNLHRIRIPVICPGEEIKVEVPFQPYRTGSRDLVTNLDCNLFQNIKANCSVHVPF